MSSLAPTAPIAATGLPVAGAANGVGGVPNPMRSGSAAVKQDYASAQGFEEMLLQQLSQSLAQSSGLSSEGEGSGEAGSSEGGGEAASGMLSSLLPQTLTEGVMREGGLGLAPQLMGALDPAASATATAPRSAGSMGGVPAPASGVPAPASAASAPTTARAAIAPTGGVTAK